MAGVLAGAGCGGDANLHERQGDRAYAESRFPDAATEYRLATEARAGRGEVWAKLGATGLRLGDWALAAEAYRQLAASDALRVAEAVEGLQRAARGAEHAADYPTMRSVFLTLQSVAPERASGRLALEVARHAELTAEQRLALLPLAAAAAPDRRTTDSLLGAYGDALRETGACAQGIRVYRSVLRRAEVPAMEERLLAGRAMCALELGLAHLADEPWTAEGWFLEAVDAAPESAAGREALVGLGDARAAQGDLIGAALAYQSAAGSGTETDSITIRAMKKLNDIAAAPRGDSGGTTP